MFSFIKNTFGKKITVDDIALKCKAINAEKIAIYGGGEIGLQILQALEKEQLSEKVICFVDLRADYESFTVKGMPVIGPFKLKQEAFTPDTLIIASKAFKKDILMTIQENALVGDKVSIITF
ncbi:nucleoside-diphosphate sugar epimerase/dehydratase [Gayadomonas joobiniege]|uniref:nucleoside-diphosphate sugar epimerase/dehydratase n=1 Tax=Gayadomonas joobiniege TaxID=1234606 RepID=UPI00036002F3|nr:hypothetical protein [Gayadomonas joobiniege]